MCLIAKALHDGNLNHLLVNKVKEYPNAEFTFYALYVYQEMTSRGFKCDWNKFMQFRQPTTFSRMPKEFIFNGWHNDRYLRQCLHNLQEKYDCGGIRDEEWARIVKKYPGIEEG